MRHGRQRRRRSSTGGPPGRRHPQVRGGAVGRRGCADRVGRTRGGAGWTRGWGRRGELRRAGRRGREDWRCCCSPRPARRCDRAPDGPLPYALVWWQGEAAEAYQRRVQERVNALAALSARLECGAAGRRAAAWEALEEAAAPTPRWPRLRRGEYPRRWPCGRRRWLAAAARLEALADEVRDGAHGLAAALARARSSRRCRGPGDLSLASQWARLEARDAGVVGPGGAWGEALALEVLAVRLRAAARVYAEVEASVAAVLAGVGAGADLAARGGWLTDGHADADRHPGATDPGARPRPRLPRRRRPRRRGRGSRRWPGPGRRGGAR